MRNSVGLRDLFGDNMKSAKLFLDWCKESDELCEYDYEHIAIALELGAVNNTPRFFHFHDGNLLDFLEEQGYYIGTPIRGSFKYVTVVQFKGDKKKIGRPVYSNSGVVNRYRALELGCMAAIKHLEQEL